MTIGIGFCYGPCSTSRSSSSTQRLLTWTFADSTPKSLPAEQRLCSAAFTVAPVVNGNSFATLNAKPASAAKTNTQTESSDR